NYVLIRTKKNEAIAEELGILWNELTERIKECHDKLRNERKKRKKPGLDDKTLTSWNAMMISGYVEAYKALGTADYLEIAKKNADFITNHQIQESGRLFHSYKNGKSTINGYLEDYAFMIEAFLNLYEATFDIKYLQKAEHLIVITNEDFLDAESDMYFFTSAKDRPLITKTIEISDNVIPASNSVMAKNLFKIGQLTGNQDYINRAEKMLQTILDKISEYPQSYSNWLDLLMNFSFPFFEIAVTGENFQKYTSFFQKQYLPNTVLAGTNSDSDLALLKDRLVKGKDLIYICQEGTCQLPVESSEEALQLLKQV
ncbi:MAG TPA: beta-L-arabinofuranosidase domain-containing protein, partial [Christiangramia sp.]|nr:beta-L-arabinofuranosidase domain-containing protein [Christiangramia sp.]